MKPLRGIPSSRTYWELKAEQMMNRIFDPEAIIDLEPQPDAADAPASLQPPGTAPTPGRSHRDSPPPSPARGAAGRAVGHTASRGANRPPSAPPGRTSTVPSQAASRPLDRQLLLIASLGGVCLVSALCSVLFLNHTWKVQENLREERNLLLVERLRSLGPAAASPQASTVAPATPPPASAPTASSAGADLPPPPQDEPWVQQLGRLPQNQGDRAPVLRVPVSPRLAAAAPPASRPARTEAPAAASAPQLVGVVAAPGRSGSAIFQVGGSSTSVGVGESIGSSGWRLQAADGDSAVIERNGETRRISLNSGT